MQRTDGSGYTVTETLHASGGTMLYRAVRDDRRTVVVKAVDPRRCPRGSIEKLRHEYEIASPIELGAIVRPLALETFQGMPALVLEDYAGTSLDRLLGAPMAIDRFLELAIRIASAVGDVHRRGIVHKDLKPENILVDPITLDVKIADFGMATRIPREQQRMQPPQVIEGSLPYVSPEQTGRMNRAIDTRSDLYSLGVTFFQMLTGRLPFDARDPLEWVHCHVAREPPSPAQLVADVPEPVARIVLRLLAKMADDRYQSARGLRRDLERCLAEWRMHGRVDPFPIGERDSAERLQVPQKLYGREGDRAVLLARFERLVADGAPELLLVSGHSGVGKSSLVHELLRPLARERGLFLEGKFEQFARNVPYSPLVHAFGELIGDIAAGPEEHRASRSASIRDALRGNARLLTELIPSLKLLVGEPPPLPDISAPEMQQAMRGAFAELVRVFTRDGRPLVLFVDDVQWADAATLALLEAIVSDPSMRHLLVVGAFRAGEVGPWHPAARMIDAVRATATAVTEVALSPLHVEHVVDLVADTVRASPDEVRPLATLLHRKTGGNPLFVVQLLAALDDERLVRFDEQQWRWTWDIAPIAELGEAASVTELLAHKVSALPEAARGVLETAACLANQAPLSILAAAHGASEEETLRALEQAMAAGLVAGARDRYAFAHDRVQQAAYSTIAAARRSAVHLRIGRQLLQRLPREQWSDWIFEIATQLNLGRALISDPAERTRAAELNLLAGRKAYAAAAYLSAIPYFSEGEGLLAPDGFDSCYELTYALKLERARCEWLCGHLDAAAAALPELHRHARSRADRAAAYRVEVALQTTQGHREEASRTALSACSSLLGIDLPLHPDDAALREAAQRTLARLGDRAIEDLLELPALTDPEMQAGMALLSASLPAAYRTDPNLHDLMCCHVVELTLRHGTSAFSPHGLVTFGAMVGRLFDDWDKASRFGAVACELIERRGMVEGEASALFTVAAFIHFWMRPVQELIPMFRKARRAALEHGDMNCACYAALFIVISRLRAGDPLHEVSAEIEPQLDLVRRAGYAEIEGVLVGIRRAIRRLRGSAAGDDEQPGATPPLHPHLLVAASSALADFLLGDADGARREIRDNRANVGEHRGLIPEDDHRFVTALVLAAGLERVPPEERAEDLATLEACHEKLERCQRRCPANFRGRYLLVSAELARLHGRDLEAMQLYEDAIAAARESGFVHDEALGNELAAAFHAARGFPRIAVTYLTEARGCYLRWGADAKVQELDRRRLRPLLDRRASGPSSSFRIQSEHLDLASVLKASRTISSEIVLEDLVRTLLHVVLQEGGARRACLLLRREQRLLAEAEAFVAGDGVRATMLQSLPIERSSLVPVSLVDYVRRSKERVILDDAAAPTRFSTDAYFTRNRPRSVLGLPIVRQAEVVGVLYLENDLAAGAFTPDRLAALTLLASQAAISIENARLYREAQRAVQLRDEFLSIASHELRTPVATLKLSLQMLERAAAAGGPVDPAIVARSMGRAVRQGERLSRLIHDLLDITRLEAGRLSLELAEVDLARLARDVVEQLEPTLAAAGCTVEVRCECPVVGRWDASRLDQVVTNLLSNAVKFGAGKPIELDVRAREGTASLAVRDHGIGIDSSEHAHIFERFGRAVPTANYGGLGLGLFISRRIAEAHGGTIRVASEPGEGSTFTLELPCPPAAVSAGSPGAC